MQALHHARAVRCFNQHAFKKFCKPAYLAVQNLVADSAAGSFITDQTGKQYLDLACGIGVTSTGHSHPAVASAISQQAERHLFAQQNCAPYHAALVNSITSLQRVVPSNLTKFFFTNSGSEAVDNAVKIARFATQRPNIIGAVLHPCRHPNWLMRSQFG